MTAVSTHPGEKALQDLPEDAIEEFARHFRGDLVFPDDTEYDEAREVWNGMINKYPAVVARCSGTADVVAAVNFAREQDLEVAVRGGGHNAAGSAVCDGGIVVDLEAMDGVRVDQQARTVRVGGGAELGDVDRETQLFGLAMPLGAVSQTGVAGLTLNGGYGHLHREYGLACDNVVSVDVVTADGEVVTASEDEHEDLYWAVRGGGGNFGVVTSFEFDLHEVGPEVYAIFVVYPADDVEATLRQFEEADEALPRDGNVLWFFGFVPEDEMFPEDRWGEPMVAYLGSYLGDVEDGDAATKPFRTVAEPIADFSGPMQFTELQSTLDEDYPDGRQYYWKSTYLTDLDDEVFEFVERRSRESPSKLSTVDLWRLGGAVSDVGREETPIWHREEPYLLNFEANWDDPEDTDENVTWVRESVAELREMDVAGGEYANFPGLNEDPARATFGDNYDRLARIKARYDPENLFHRNRNVEPAE